MATPFQNCVIALTGKFPETHGEQKPLKSNAALGGVPVVNTGLTDGYLTPVVN